MSGLDASSDINKIAAEVIIQATDRAVQSVAEPARVALRRLLHSISSAYTAYLEQTFNRVKNIRTFLRPNEPIDLLSHYVPVTLSLDNKNFTADQLITLAVKDKRIVVSGLAGRGKSVLMRFIALSMYHVPKGKIPLFLELRSINSISIKDILQYVHAQYKGNTNIQYDDFIKAVKGGYFTLLLDGFDEIDPDFRDQIERQIIQISVDYPKLGIVISGRPDDRFSSWENFSTYTVCAMSLKSTRRLIESANYDADVKKTFLKRLTEDFFDQHESFLSTPLLAIMLMLTFEEYAEIPTSLHVFYRNAFDTLMRRHDAMKSQFLRKTHSNCTADQFRGIFSSFCLLTYSKSKFQFNHEEILNYINISLKQQRIKSSAEKVLKDLIESICLLQKEGFEISFVHRSFQEYFCALFVSLAPAGLVNKYLSSGQFRIQDSVLPMLYGMVPERVESEWANKITTNILSEYNTKEEIDFIKFLRDLYPEITFSIFRAERVHIFMDESELSRQIAILRRIYPAHFFVTGRKSHKILNAAEAALWNSNIIKEMVRLESDGLPEFEGSAAAASVVNAQKSSSFEDFRVEASLVHKALFNIVGLDKNVDDIISALKNIRKDQRARERGDDEFLKSVFV